MLSLNIPRPRIVLVCGGRFYTNKQFVFEMLDQCHRIAPFSLLIEGEAGVRDVVTGEALEGVDVFAGDWAKSRFVPYIGTPAKWNVYGSEAGLRRNIEQLETYMPHVCIAFPGGTGTVHMTRAAGLAGCAIYRFTEAMALSPQPKILH